MKRKAVITIEVLIAMIIMFSAIVALTSSLKTLNLFRLKKEKYVLEYITYLNLTSLLSNKKLVVNKTNKFVGKVNDIEYNIKCLQYKAKRTYSYSETKDSSGNFGPFNIVLYKCEINLKSDIINNKKSIYVVRDYKVQTDEFH